MKKCARCGYGANDGDKFCASCGAALGGSADLPVKAENKTLFLKYADFLDDELLYRAALCKLNGVGVVKDEEAAFEMFRTLAFRGYYDGMYKLAEIYLGRTPQDRDAAFEWLKIAADGGHAPSKIKLRSEGFESAKPEDPLCVPQSNDGFEGLVKNALHSIVLIKSMPKGSDKSTVGTGFITDEGYVVTNAHVLGENPEYISAKFEPQEDGRSYNLLPVVIEADQDIAVLKFTGLAERKITERGHLKFRTEPAAFGESVYTIGNPLGMGLSVSRGVVSCPSREFSTGVSEFIQTDLTVNHGNSGGALLDMENRVLGMITFKPGKSEGGIAMCVPSKYIMNVINGID